MAYGKSKGNSSKHSQGLNSGHICPAGPVMAQPKGKSSSGGKESGETHSNNPEGGQRAVNKSTGYAGYWL